MLGKFCAVITPGASSLPGPDSDMVGHDLPDLGRLRAALRPAELPLPHPRSVLEAAHRASDLLHAEHARDAARLVEEFRTAQAPSSHRFHLLRAGLHAALLSADPARIERALTPIVSLLHRQGFTSQAAATVSVLLERWPSERGAPSAAREALSRSGVGRRRGRTPEAPPEMLVVVRALEWPALAAPRRAVTDPRRDAARLRAALSALPAVREQLLVDPERELRVRLAQALEGAGDPAAATTAALDLLELVDEQQVESEQPVADPLRTVIAAHAVLARTLFRERPLPAVHHALEALESLHDVEDPPLRIGLITSLLQALMAAGATSQASFTAGRLASLQRTLRRDSLRIAPLLAVAAQRVQAERYDAAQVPLEQARAIAREQRDHHALMEASRLAASIHERRGDHASSLVELRQMASHARWLADDLETPTSAQGELIRTELEANALMMRRALDLGRLDPVTAAVRAIERRTRQGGAGAGLPAEFLWDHRVDARVGLFIATGDAHAREVPGVSAEDCELRRREAMQAIDEMPAGHDQRARYWATYLDDRHAHLLAARGETGRAKKAARRAREGWQRLGMEEDAARVAALQAALKGA